MCVLVSLMCYKFLLCEAGGSEMSFEVISFVKFLKLGTGEYIEGSEAKI